MESLPSPNPEAEARRLAAEWRLQLGEAMRGGMCALVLAATAADGAEVVLKIPKRETEERHAAQYLSAFAGHGGVPVLKEDSDTGSVLMPRLRPGTDLTGVDEREAVEICARLILRIRSAPQMAAPHLETWFSALDPAADDPLVSLAATVSRRLLSTADRDCLLHADLHHFNILRSGDEWVAIDPKVMRGDPSFETSAFMRNPIDNVPGADVMAERIARFSETLGDPPDRIWGWAFAQTALSSVWSPGTSDWRDAAEAIYEAGRVLGLDSW